MSRSLEQLESRRLMSAGVTWTVDNNGNLVVFGTESSDQIAVTTSNGVIDVKANDQTFSLAANTVTGIKLSGLGGNDKITIDAATTQPATLIGGEGNDTLSSGGGVATLQGGNGADSLTGGANLGNTLDDSDNTTGINIKLGYGASSIAGGDTISGSFTRLLTGSGDDDIEIQGQYFNYVDAGAGDDNINFYQANSGLVTLHGGDGNDTIIGQDGHFQIFGDAGNDTFNIDRDSGAVREWFGGSGIDTLVMSCTSNNEWNSDRVTLDDVANDGNSMNASLLGGRWLDNAHSDIEVVIGGPGADSIVGSGNNETLIGGGNSDTLIGNGGNDELDGGLDNDSLVGSSGNDTFNGGFGTDTIVGGGGVDTTLAPQIPAWASIADGVLTINGTAAADNISTRSGTGLSGASNFSVTLNGNTFEMAAADLKQVVINGNGGDDYISLYAPKSGSIVNGGAGDDTVQAGYGNDTMIGGDGNDSLSSDYDGVYAEGDAGNDTIALYGTNDSAVGGDGDDTIIAQKDGDSIDGGAGNNEINGTITQSNGNSGGATDSGSGTGGGTTSTGGKTTTSAPSIGVAIVNKVLTINGGSGADVITLIYHPAAKKLFVTLDGQTQMFPTSHYASIVVNGNAGNDTINATQADRFVYELGGAGNDLIYGSAFADRIYGGADADYIYAGAGNDVVYGEAGNDRIFGGAGADHIDGGAGANVLRGEDGKDRLTYRSGDNISANKGDYLSLAPNLA